MHGYKIEYRKSAYLMLFFVSYSFKPTIQWVFILSACCPISFSAQFLSSKAHLIHFSIGLLIFLFEDKGFQCYKGFYRLSTVYRRLLYTV